MATTPPSPYQDITDFTFAPAPAPAIPHEPPPPHHHPGFMPLTPGRPFHLYSERASSWGTATIGPHKQEPCFAMTFHQYSFPQRPRPFLMLHDGLSLQDRVIGSATNVWTEAHGRGVVKFHDHYEMAVGDLKEPLVAVHGGTTWRPWTVLRWSLDMQQEEEEEEEEEGSADRRRRRGEFEWQSCTLSFREMASLGGDRTERDGFRLVAVGARPEEGALALCSSHGRSMTKIFSFAFQDAARVEVAQGGGGGEAERGYRYGRTWQVMAFLTGLTTWHRRCELRR